MGQANDVAGNMQGGGQAIRAARRVEVAVACAR